MIDVGNLRELLGRVTPGPWVWCADPYGGHRLISWVPEETFPSGSPRYMKVHDDGSAGGEYSPAIDVAGEDATLIAMAPDLAAEVLRLTAERDAVVAANRQLVARDAEARLILGDWIDGKEAFSLSVARARAFLAGEGK